MDKYSPEHHSLYYCFLPKMQTERIICIPKALEDCPGFLYGCLYKVDRPLGEALFESLEIAKKIFPLDENKNVHTIADATMYEHFERPVYRSSLTRQFLKEIFQDAMDIPADLDLLFSEASIYKKFVDSYTNTGTPCTAIAFERLCRKLGRGIKGAEIIQLDLEEDCFSKIGTTETTDDTLDILLKSYPFTTEEQAELQQMLAPYMNDPRQFCSALRDWLLKYDPESEVTITYHFYKLDTLYDLFSATMRELTKTRRSINKCIQCGKLFVTVKRSDQKYCSLSCEKARKKAMQPCDILYDTIRNWLSTPYATSKSYDDFMIKNTARREEVKSGEKSVEEYRKWLEDERTKYKYKRE